MEKKGDGKIFVKKEWEHSIRSLEIVYKLHKSFFQIVWSWEF